MTSAAVTLGIAIPTLVDALMRVGAALYIDYPPRPSAARNRKSRCRHRRLVEAGKVETVSTYHFDDMMGESRSRQPMLVAMKPDDWHDRKEGIDGEVELTER